MTRLEALQYFRHLSLVVVVALSVLALSHAYRDLRWLLLVDSLGALGVLLARRWVLDAPDAARLLRGTHLVTTLCLAVLLGHALATGQNRSLAAWFVPVLPVVAAFLGGTRAGLVWIGITILTAMLLWASEYLVSIPPNLLTSPEARALARVVLILTGAAFAITARRVSERQTRELVDSLEAEQEAKRVVEGARIQAETASRAKSDFLAVISHEIRTPLNGMIGLNSLLLETTRDQASRQYLEQARASGEMLLHLVDDILDYVRLEAGQVVLESRAFDPHAVVAEVRAIVMPQAEARGLRLAFSLDAPHALQGDPARLRQILLNLLSNAIKFTPLGEIRFSCQPETRPGPRTWLRFVVADPGIGIDPAVAADLFGPFTLADASTTRRQGGSGLGLAISRTIAELMGGRIGFRSEPGKGSTFWVELPFDPPPAQQGEATAPASPRSAGSGVPSGQPVVPLRVLVAEDNPVNQFVSAEMLRKLGCEVVLAGDGRAAVEAEEKERFDLVFMDCDMPVLDGFGAARAIRAREPPGRHVPIVAMTAAAFEGDRDRCRDAGMDDFLPKPVRYSDLAACLERWLHRQRALS